jgi:hypothetical protein
MRHMSLAVGRHRPLVAEPLLRRAKPPPPVHLAQRHSRITTPILRPRWPGQTSAIFLFS